MEMEALPDLDRNHCDRPLRFDQAAGILDDHRQRRQTKRAVEEVRAQAPAFADELVMLVVVDWIGMSSAHAPSWPAILTSMLPTEDVVPDGRGYRSVILWKSAREINTICTGRARDR
jgi:hypothetical protein